MTDADDKTMSYQPAGPDRDHDEAGLPVLLLAALAAMLATVGAVWALAATSAMWALLSAMVVAVSGMVLLFVVIDRQLADSDGAARERPGARP